MKEKILIALLCLGIALVFVEVVQAETPNADKEKTQLQSDIEQGSTLKQQTIDAFLKKDFVTAVKLGKEWVKKQPREPLAHFLLGCAYSRMGQQTKILKHHKIACTKLSGEQAILRWTTELADQYPTSTVALTLKGTAFDLLEKRTESIKVYKKAISMDPNYPLPYLNLANVYKWDKQYDAALKVYDALISRVPKCVEAYSGLGLMYDEALNQPDKAQDAYEKAMTINPSYVNVLFNYGNLMLRIEKYDRAKGLYLRAIKEQPDFAPAYVNLGGAYYLDGDIQKALEYFKKGAKLDPDGEYGKTARKNIRILSE